MNNVVIFILIILYVFGPVFNKFSSFFDIIILISVYIDAYFFVFKSRFIPPHFYKFSVLFLVFLYTSFILLFEFELGTAELLKILFRPVRILITLFAAFAIVTIIRDRYKSEYLRTTLFFVFGAIVFHGLVMIAQWYSVPFKDMVYKYTTTGEFRSSFDYNFRMGGFSGSSGGAILSVVQSLGIVLAPFVIYLSKNKITRVFIFLGIVISVLSVLICGRSGVWSALAFTPVSYFLIPNSRQRGIKLIKLIFISAIFVVGLLQLASYLSSKSGDIPLIAALNRTLDTFIVFSETGEFEDGTVNTLKNHYLLPGDPKIIVFGEPEHLINTQFDRGLDSDVGYVRNFWSFGIFGFFIFLFPFLFYYRMSFLHIGKNYSASVLFVVSSVMFIFHFKESFMYTRMLFSIYSIILSLFYIERVNSNRAL